MIPSCLRAFVVSICAIMMALLSGIPEEGGSVRYVDVAANAGLTARNVCGNPLRKDYTLEVTGNGCAFLDYDRDGFLDILLVNGRDCPCQLYLYPS